MKIMLDKSPRHIRNYSAKYETDFWQLRTPLTRNAIAGVPYGLDNGCFKQFNQSVWEKLLEDCEQHNPVFVCLPDIVGDARRTLELFKCFLHKTGGLPRALVLQDGIGDHEIPWFDIKAVFVGGSDAFKISTEAMNAAKCARMLGKWVHVGRVNSVERAHQWLDVADSIDGSGISQYDHQLEAILKIIKRTHNLQKQQSMAV